MSREITLRIGEIRIDAEADCVDGALLERALQAALEELARRVQGLLAERPSAPEAVAIGDVLVRNETAEALLASRDFRRLTDAVFAEIEARLRAAP